MPKANQQSILKTSRLFEFGLEWRHYNGTCGNIRIQLGAPIRIGRVSLGTPPRRLKIRQSKMVSCEQKASIARMGASVPGQI